LQTFFSLLFCLDWNNFVSLKQKIFDQFQQKWRSDIENSPKGLSYRLFKENFEFEHYLDILPDKDRMMKVIPYTR
jgi:gamma-glutamylcysteine synthetase